MSYADRLTEEVDRIRDLLRLLLKRKALTYQIIAAETDVSKYHLQKFLKLVKEKSRKHDASATEGQLTGTLDIDLSRFIRLIEWIERYDFTAIPHVSVDPELRAQVAQAQILLHSFLRIEQNLGQLSPDDFNYLNTYISGHYFTFRIRGSSRMIYVTYLRVQQDETGTRIVWRQVHKTQGGRDTHDVTGFATRQDNYAFLTGRKSDEGSLHALTIHVDPYHTQSYHALALPYSRDQPFATRTFIARIEDPSSVEGLRLHNQIGDFSFADAERLGLRNIAYITDELDRPSGKTETGHLKIYGS